LPPGVLGPRDFAPWRRLASARALDRPKLDMTKRLRWQGRWPRRTAAGSITLAENRNIVHHSVAGAMCGRN
jgi:hypothetical protein